MIPPKNPVIIHPYWEVNNPMKNQGMVIEKSQLTPDTFDRLCDFKKTTLFKIRKQTHANIHAYKSSIGKRHPLILLKMITCS
jgi:hypothetical protein